MKPSREKIKKGIVNTFGAFGYLFSMLQWLWAVLLYFSLLQAAVLFVSPSATPTPPMPHTTLTLPGPITAAILIAVTIIMIAVTIYALVKVPMNIVEASSKAIRQTSDAVAPMVIHMQHKKDTKKARKKLSVTIIFIIKLCLVIIPVILAAASDLLKRQFIDHSVAMIISYGLACCTFIFFAVQYLLAKILRISLDSIR